MPDAAPLYRIAMSVTQGDAIRAEPGEALLAALLRAEIGIRHVCGGRGACGTCRIAIAPDWVGRLPAPTRNEARLLAVLPAALHTHRLACQITLDRQTDGLAFRLDTPLRRPMAEAQSITPMEA